ncbi:Candidapepsin-8 [Lachnellula suecica]|uniref:Candidapepsin-8 n=1 Tax=Lachnellula suecica TaxID=602035 RepID=A0A8T9C4R2_9HELO|nr:Candidapepsin-8 [Lachnellula suecica]
MYSVPRPWAVVLFLLGRALCAAPTALSLSPSLKWYGDDGTWSAVSIRVGTPQQWVDVMVNTVSSETWLVGPGGCPGNNSICTSARGGIYNISQSSTDEDLGFFSLGVDSRLGGNGYANYGLDTIEFGTTGVVLNSTVIGSINETNYFLGMLGLGVVPGSFKNVTSLSAISGLVETNGAIPSHSYGYTAGATYQQKGEPISVTLGGYDASRFVAHNTTFNLNPSQDPAAYIYSISVSSSGTSNNWTTPIQLLSTTDRVTATIDSSTPYLWLPQSVCDQFAQTLGLSYNSTLDLYTFDGNASQHDVLQKSQLTFTVTLSDTTTSPEVVNITLPYAAFDLQLTYPFLGPNASYGSPESSKYYFPIKRATTAAGYTIGRAFLQEAYLITDYERNTYSVHQAVHTSDPIGNTSIINISGRETGFLARFRRRPAEPPANEAIGSTSYPTEVGADATHARFELPAPLGPAELDSESGTLQRTLSGTTEEGSATTDSHNISAYERARRKLERQQEAANQDPSDPRILPPGSGSSLAASASASPVSPGFVSHPTSPTSPPPTYRRLSPGNVVYAGPLPNGVQLPIVVPHPIDRNGAEQTLLTEPGSTLGSSFTDNQTANDDIYGAPSPRSLSATAVSDVSISAPSGSLPGSASVVSAASSQQPLIRNGRAREEDESKFLAADMLVLKADMQTREAVDPYSRRRRLDGEDDLVHVPVPAEQRFSWEEERMGKEGGGTR